MKAISPFFNLNRTNRWPQLFEDFEDFFGAPQTQASESFVPRCDIEESEKEFVLSFDVPGMAPEDVKVEVRNRELKIAGERKRETKTEAGKLHRFERTYGSFERVFSLPDGIEVSKIQAHHADGVLKITLPKGESIQSRQIEVKRLN